MGPRKDAGRWSVQIQEMPVRDCYAALSRANFGRLACAKENQPYVVPIYFAFQENEGDPRLYGFTIPGQKVEWMRANPLVCVEVDEVEGFDRWISVIANGRFEELLDTPYYADTRRLTVQLLQARAMWWQPGSTAFARGVPRDQKGELTPIYYQIHMDQITGLRCVPDSR